MLKPDQIATEIGREIGDDPTINGSERIMVSAQKTGSWPFKKHVIKLAGTVRRESERKKAEEHAHHAAGELPVVNEIQVSAAE